MQAGKPEVIVDPTESQRADIAARTGVTVPDTAAAVAIHDSGAGYRISVLPGTASATSEIVSEETDQPTAAPATGFEVSREEAIAELGKPQLLRTAESGLIGPRGSLSGSRGFDMKLQGRCCIPGDYRYHANECQPFVSTCDTTIYVHWVDGSELPAHYLVILRQHATFGVGSGMIHNADHIRGFGTYNAKTEMRNVKVSAGDIQLLRTSPDSGGRAAQMRVDVSLTQDVDGGKAIAPAVLSDYFNPDAPVTGWASDNRQAAPDAKWEFAMDNTLNDGLNGRSLTDNFYNDQTVKGFPTPTSSGFAARTYALWRVRPPQGSRDVKFSFGLELLQSFLLLTRGWIRPSNQDARGGPLGFFYTGLQPFSLDLAEVIKPRPK
jgi:hypothetical protein